MKVTQGILPGQVLQRNRKNRGGANIEGTCRHEGPVELRVTKQEKVCLGNAWKIVGSAKKKRFNVELAQLQTGGPYCVELRIRQGGKTLDELKVKDVFVGDVWIMAGQSNMQGVGDLLSKPDAHPFVRCFYMRDEWGLAEEPLTLVAEGVDIVHNGYGNGPERPSKASLRKIRRSNLKGVGPGHAFGLDMVKRTNVPQGLIACAEGGASMSQWSPDLLGKGGASLYGAMIRRYKKLGQEVAGILWYQGESDTNRGDISSYTRKMVHLVSATRKDTRLPKLPWLVVQLGRHAHYENAYAWNSIQEQQRRLPEMIPHLDVAPAVDLSLDDFIHISGEGQLILGKRLARLADQLVHKNPKAKPGIVLKRIRFTPSPPNSAVGGTAIEITYGNVAGQLTSKGLATGFSLVNAKGEDLHYIFKTTLRDNRVYLHINMNNFFKEKQTLSYGHGRLPYCNITDSEDMSLPVVHALPINPHQIPTCDKSKAAPTKKVHRGTLCP